MPEGELFSKINMEDRTIPAAEQHIWAVICERVPLDSQYACLVFLETTTFPSFPSIFMLVSSQLKRCCGLSIIFFSNNNSFNLPKKKNTKKCNLPLHFGWAFSFSLNLENLGCYFFLVPFSKRSPTSVSRPWCFIESCWSLASLHFSPCKHFHSGYCQ